MNVYLIGYRGSGKSTIGKRLAKDWGKEFLDTDQLIVESEKMSIPEIFSKRGEASFRQIESAVLKKVSKIKGAIVSTGGGIIINADNRKLIRDSGIAVYLTATVQTLFRRIEGDKNRPALTASPLLEEITELIKKREPLYCEVSSFILDTDQSLDASLKELKTKLCELGVMKNDSDL